LSFNVVDGRLLPVTVGDIRYGLRQQQQKLLFWPLSELLNAEVLMERGLG